MGRLQGYFVAVVVAGCGPTIVMDPSEDPPEGSTSTTAVGTGGTGQATTDLPDPPDPEPDLGSGFAPDVWDGEWCSTWEQNCPSGDKCVWYANDGGNAWNVTHCVPLDPQPAQDGKPRVYDGVATGIDNCEAGSICCDVDAETSEGVCYSHCIGSETDPGCPSADSVCTISAEGFNLCHPICDPLVQNCGADEACLGVSQRRLHLRSGRGRGRLHRTV